MHLGSRSTKTLRKCTCSTGSVFHRLSSRTTFAPRVSVDQSCGDRLQSRRAMRTMSFLTMTTHPLHMSHVAWVVAPQHAPPWKPAMVTRTMSLTWQGDQCVPSPSAASSPRAVCCRFPPAWGRSESDIDARCFERPVFAKRDENKQTKTGWQEHLREKMGC